jgi:hypothetical protein
VQSHSGGVSITSQTSEVVTTVSVQSVPEGKPEELLQPRSARRAKLDQALRGASSSTEVLARTLVQLLQVEAEPSRRLLIGELADLPGAAAGTRLAERALYDLSAAVRQDAVAALKRRPPEQFRQVLLDGLRHPWQAVADHAAEALAALDDRRAVAELVPLLEAPDPAGAIFDPARKGYVVREIVQLNHLRNCSLCHEPSTSPSDPLRGKVPTVGEPLPVLYYQDPSGDFVRADVTFLRPDFSVMQPVADADPWPSEQRYDYLVRTRAATVQEQAARNDRRGRDYPQRQAVLFALRALTLSGTPTAP